MKEIILHKNQGIGLVDDEDFDFANQFKWRKGCRGYVVRSFKEDGRCKTIYLHRLLVKCPKNLQIDHINRNKLDNRKENLRFVTNQQNQENKNKPSNNTSGYRGVTRHGRGWVAQVGRNGKVYYCGMHDTPEQASLAADQMRKHLGFLDSDPNYIKPPPPEYTKGRNRNNKNNTSGYRGVWYNKKRQKWTSTVRLNYEKHYLGYFDTAEQANEAAINKRKELGII